MNPVAHRLSPPVAPRRPVVTDRPGGPVADDYAWLRDRDDPAVRAHLEAENAHTEADLAPLAALRGQLFEELRGRIHETDRSAPARRGDWWYFTRTVEGLEYAIHARAAGSPDAPEQVILDENVLAEGHEYLQLGGLAVSPDQRLLAYATDTSGDEVLAVRVRDLDTGADLADLVPRASYGLAWANDSRTLFYTVPDDAMRPWQLWRHEIGTSAGEDVLVLQEDDERFFVGVGRTRSEAFVVASLHSKVTSEVWVLPADDPAGRFRVVAPRRQGVEYDLEHHGDRFFLVTNDVAPNFRLVACPVDDPGPRRWEEVVPPRADVRLYSVDAFARHLVLSERADGLRRLRVAPLEGSVPDLANARVIDQPEPVHNVGVGRNLEFDTQTLRYRYTSLATPLTDVDYDLVTGERTVVKQQPVRGYDPDVYRTRREWAVAADGTRIPISLVHRHDVEPAGENPLVLYGYGAYEHSIEPAFSPLRLGLLDRGVVYAIAHVRGGGEMGRRWYEDGKLRAKHHTFDDFVACAEHLVSTGWTRPERLAIRGGSAGGLLVGAVLNLRPDLFRACAAHVPFVDVVNTMSDPTLPLTAIEWEEWGDPRDPEFYEVIRAYSPYDNVRAVRYPDLLVTAGINDPRVGYWEPAKWVARIRAASPDTRVLLKTELGAGHGGPSGRYESWREEALVQAFLLDALRVTQRDGQAP